MSNENPLQVVASGSFLGPLGLVLGFWRLEWLPGLPGEMTSDKKQGRSIYLVSRSHEWRKLNSIWARTPWPPRLKKPRMRENDVFFDWWIYGLHLGHTGVGAHAQNGSIFFFIFSVPLSCLWFCQQQQQKKPKAISPLFLPPFLFKYPLSSSFATAINYSHR